MVQVGSPQLPGYGGQAAKPIGWQDSPYQNWPGNGNGNGNGTVAAPPTGNGAGPFIPAATIPNNFWGYVMLVVGMR